MIDTDALLDSAWPPPDAPDPVPTPRKCRRHQWFVDTAYPSDAGDLTVTLCRRCGRVKDDALSRRNRNNRKRGNAIQRQRITALGGQNLAGNNPNLDGIGLMFRYESKSARPGRPIGPGRKLKVATFPETLWALLRGIPAQADQTRVLIVTEAAGRGHKARSMVIVDFDDWLDLHGEEQR